MAEPDEVLAGRSILVAAGHTSLAEALASGLSRSGARATPVAPDLDAAVAEVAGHHPDVFLLEAALAGRRVTDAAAALHRAAPGTRTVVLDGGTPGEADIAFSRGLVDAVLHPGAGLDVLRETLPRVLRGERVPRTGPSAEPALERRRPGDDSALSEREREVLARLARGDSNPRIAEELGISVNTVRTHVQSLLRKLGVDRRSQVTAVDRPDVVVGAGLTPTWDGRGDGRPLPRPVVLALAGSHRCLAQALADELGARTGRPARCAGSVADVGSGVTVLQDPVRGDDVLDLLRAVSGSGAGALAFAPSADEDLLAQGLEVGVQGWLGPEASLADVVTALRAVEQGEMYLSPTVLTPVLRRLMRPSRARSDEPAFIDSLSPRELEIMRCLVAGMTKREVADRLFLSVHTVHSHVQRMMRRADRHTTVALVAVARRQGVQPVGVEPPSRAPGGPAGVPAQRGRLNAAGAAASPAGRRR